MYKSRYKKASARIKKRGKTKRFFNVFIKISLPVFLLIGIIFILRADFMQLKSIEVVGNQDISTQEIKTLIQNSLTGHRFLFVPKSNLLLFSSKSLEGQILNNFPRAEKVEVSKSLDGIVQITLTERQKDFVWCVENEACFLMDRGGLVFASASPEEILGKIIFRGNIYGNPISQNFEEEEDMQNYLKVIEGLQNFGLQVFSVVVESPNKTVINSDIGDIFLNPEEDMSLSVPNVSLLIQEIRGQDSSTQFEYIDARFGTKVFYKLQTP